MTCSYEVIIKILRLVLQWWLAFKGSGLLFNDSILSSSYFFLK